MLFAIICQDKPGALELRLATRPSHLEYLDGQAEVVVQGGPVLDAEGKPCGSLLLVDVADQAAAEALAAGDPYAKAGLFESVTIRPFRSVFKDGMRIG
ncbi:YciI family protein [Roseomonas marmotae]|uniref:YciI family protein n=1 Tax=Roseomonas marmotae TaxID=2768161 RepID=A0ABS3KGW0_9PROT|nr:YciI family protein [Roseomonas marmotae]MBO1076680.1 YciI family protein [Roseomonas marmotae]QTI79858.1 YciI family protein [Roseomonas marmotae]